MSLRCPRVITRLVIFTSENGQGKNRNRNAIPPRLRPKILVTTTSEFRTNKMIVETGNFFFFVFQSHVLFALVGKFHRGHLGGGGWEGGRFVSRKTRDRPPPNPPALSDTSAFRVIGTRDTTDDTRATSVPSIHYCYLGRKLRGTLPGPSVTVPDINRIILQCPIVLE